MQVDLASGRAGFVTELEALLRVAESLDDDQLLAPSRCHGWVASDVLMHVHLGLQEMLLGIVSPTEAPATVDAVSYWAEAPPTNDDEASATDHIRYVRLLSSAYGRPSGLVRHFAVTARTLLGAAARLTDGRIEFQGHVITTGDFLASWAVEIAIHHLDLTPELIIDPPVPEALHLARRTIEELAGGPIPDALDDATAVLVGAGRLPVPDDLTASGLHLPALG
jgi:uncharacterized protein (TIGR03083 family)